MTLQVFIVLILHGLCKEKCIELGDDTGRMASPGVCLCSYRVPMEDDDGIPFNLKWYEPPRTSIPFDDRQFEYDSIISIYER